MKGYQSLYSFTEEGLNSFRQVMSGQLDEGIIDENNGSLVRSVDQTGPFVIDEFPTARAMAEAVCASLRKLSAQALADETGLWAWLTFALRDQLFPRVQGVRRITEVHRWYPAPAADFQKAQRHLVRMPVVAWETMGEIADHLICGLPKVGPELREQLTSQQDMFSLEFQKVCRKLYFDEGTGTVRRGAAGKTGPGVARRMAAVRKQLDVTWDMTDLAADRIMQLLPPEFDGFRHRPVSSN